MRKNGSKPLLSMSLLLRSNNKPASGFSMGPPEVKAALSKGKSMLMCGGDLFALLAAVGDLQEARKDYPTQDHSKVYEQI